MRVVVVGAMRGSDKGPVLKTDTEIQWTLMLEAKKTYICESVMVMWRDCGCERVEKVRVRGRYLR